MSKPPKRSWSILLQTVKGASRSFILCSTLWILASPTSPAQQNGIDQDSEIIIVPGGENLLRWHGHAGRSYFVQVSDTNDPLRKWNWAPIIDAANNADISHQVGATAGRAFFRLKYTNQVPGPGETLDTADFDQDGLSNLAEIAPPPPLLASDATDPLDSDSDDDGMTDGYERIHGLDPNDNGSTNPDNGPNGDPDGDGLTNAEEEALGTNPQNAHSDNDLLKDGEDAVPLDGEINWKKTPESKYVWIEQVNDGADHGPPLAVNKHGQILFGISALEITNFYPYQGRVKGIWNSAKKNWTYLPFHGGNQMVPVAGGSNPNAAELVIEGKYGGGLTAPMELCDINDDGTVLGIGEDAQFFDKTDIGVGILWKTLDVSTGMYEPYYVYSGHISPTSDFPFMDPGRRIGKDGSFHASHTYVDNNSNRLAKWRSYDGTSGNFLMTWETPVDPGCVRKVGYHSIWAGPILDKDRAIFTESPGVTSNYKIWIKNGTVKEDVSFMITNEIAFPNDMAVAPTKKTTQKKTDCGSQTAIKYSWRNAAEEMARPGGISLTA